MRKLPKKLEYFLKNALDDMEDGYEYASELNRILNSDDCQLELKSAEIEALRDFADKVKKNVGEFDYYTKQRVGEIEKEQFGNCGILGFLGVAKKPEKPVWPF